MHPRVAKYVLPFCTAAFTTLAFDGAAEATMISDWESFIADETIQFNLFDTSMGTLTDVDLTIDSDYAFSLEGFGGPPPKTDYDFESTYSLEIDFDNTGVTEVFDETLTGSSCTSPPPGPPPTFCETDTMNSSGMFDDDLFALLGLSLSDFEDSGGTFDMALSTMTVEGMDCVGVTRFCNTTNTWSGDVHLTYTYEPNTYEPNLVAIAEPGTLALFGSGLAGLGFLLRRRKRAGAAEADPQEQGPPLPREAGG